MTTPIISKTDLPVYALIKKVKFYHLNPECEILKALMAKNNKIFLKQQEYEYVAFPSIKEAIKNGFVFPCPLCASSYNKIIRIQIGERLYQYALNDLDIFLIVLMYKLKTVKTRQGDPKNKKIKEFAFNFFEYYQKIGIITSKFPFEFTEQGELLAQYLIKELGINYDPFEIRKKIYQILEQFKSKYDKKMIILALRHYIYKKKGGDYAQKKQTESEAKT